MSRSFAVDLGTSTTRVFASSRGIVLREPSIIALNSQTKKVIAFGSKASEEVGKTPGYNVLMEPLQNGAVADFEVTERMLEIIFSKAGAKKFQKPRVVIGVAKATTEVERRAIREAAKIAGSSKVLLIEQSMAAAIGAGLPIGEPMASMIVDIGAGTTEAAIFALGGMVTGETTRIGGRSIDLQIQSYFRREYSLAISREVAEEVKIQLAGAEIDDREVIAEIRGRDTMSGYPCAVRVKRSEINEAISDLVGQIINTVKACLAQAPPDLGQDLIANGIFLTGGCALLRNLPEKIAKETMLPVEIVDNPMDTVVIGASKSFQFIDALESKKGN